MERSLRRLVVAGVLAAASVPASAALAAASGGAATPSGGGAAAPSGGCSRPFDDQRVRCLFDATGTPEQWTVPPGVSFVMLDAWGGQAAPVQHRGETGTAGIRGRGISAGIRGRGISAGIDVSPGETLTVTVGTRGRADGVTLRRGPRGGGGGATTVSDAEGWVVMAGGGSPGLAGSGSVRTVGARAGLSVDASGAADVSAEAPVAVRTDRGAFLVGTDPLGKVGDGRVRLLFDQYDRDGAPSVVVRRAAANPAAEARFTAVFSEPVTGFTDEDVRLVGAAPTPAGARVRPIAPLDGAHYEIVVDGVGSSDAVTVVVPAGAATDDDFTVSTASTGAERRARFHRGVQATSTESAIRFRRGPHAPVTAAS